MKTRFRAWLKSAENNLKKTGFVCRENQETLLIESRNPVSRTIGKKLVKFRSARKVIAGGERQVYGVGAE